MIPTFFSEDQRLEELCVILLSSLFKREKEVSIIHRVYDEKQHAYQFTFDDYTIVLSQSFSNNEFFHHLSAWNNTDINNPLNEKMNTPFMLNGVNSLLAKMQQFYRMAAL